MEYAVVGGAGGVDPAAGANPLHHQPDVGEHRRLRQPCSGSELLERYPEGQRLAELVDGVLLAVVDDLGPVCRSVHCANFQRPQHP
ncbi:hypothetical protein D1872_336940 [compost metagenome]